jgi:hypothetical protein
VGTFEGEEFIEGGKDFYLTPNFLHLFPNLLETDYPIKITSLQDLQRVAEHPKLRKSLLDLQPFYDNLYRTFRDEDQQFSGFRITTTRRKGQVELTITTVSEAIIFFLYEYRYFHPETKLLRTDFTFLIPGFDINYRPASLCFKPHFATTILDPRLWQPEQIFTEIEKIDQIRNYAGRWPSPENNILEKVVICIDADNDLLFEETDDGYRFRNEEIARFLEQETNLQHLSFHPYGSSFWLGEALQDFDLLRFLHNLGISFPQVKVYDFPIFIKELLLLHQVFPNVKEPLLEPTYKLTADDLRYLQNSQRYFTTFRLLPDYSYPRDLIDKYPTRVDPDNTFSKYPC